MLVTDLHAETEEKLRKLLLKHITDKSLYLKEVAEGIGIHFNTLTGILFKQKRTSPRTLRAIKEYFKVENVEYT